MKRIGVLFLMMTLLCGCGKNPAAQAAPLPPASGQWRLAGSPASETPEAINRDGLRIFPLESANVCAVMAMGEDLLVIRQEESAAIFIRLDGQHLSQKARASLPLRLSEGAPEVRLYPGRIHCYDEDQVLVLSENLEQMQRIPVPEDALGSVFLSGNGRFLYYSTEHAVRCLDLSSGISRILKEDPGKALLGLYWDDQVLLSREEDVWAFLSTQTGQTLWQDRREIHIATQAEHYYAALHDGLWTVPVFDGEAARPQMILPEAEQARHCFLPESRACLLVQTFPEEEQVRLNFCDLEEGGVTGTVTFSARCYPRFFTGIGADVFFLLYDDTQHCDVLCRWSPEKAQAVPCTYPYDPADSPNDAGLRRCGDLARQLGEHHGIRILIGKEAAAAQPWDYDFASVRQLPHITRQLEQLSRWLDQYPPGFLEALGNSLTLCLVHSITGSAESGCQDAKQGILFWEGNTAYLALAMGSASEGALYNELCHLIDTRVYGFSNAYDSWESLNPGDFRYDYDYETNRQRQSYQFLQAHSRSFADMYSMSFPREDRARIMELAMLPENEALFQAPILQQKLQKLCTGIREAFQLEDYPEALPWEQYLQSPLHPGGTG